MALTANDGVGGAGPRGGVRGLGEQAAALRWCVGDRVTALRRTTAAMQVSLARILVMRALALIANRFCAVFVPLLLSASYFLLWSSLNKL